MSKLGAEQSVEGWQPVASLYNKHIDPITGLYAQKALEFLPVDEDDRVLDVAAGAGALAIRAAKMGADVTAIDFTPELVDILNDKAEQNNLGNLEIKVMNGQDLDIEDNSFDTAFSVFGLMLFANRGEGFAELSRALVPGGKAVVVTWDKPPNNDWLALFQEVIQTAFPDMPRPNPPSFLELADTEQLAKEMQEGGFTDVEVKSWGTTSSWKDAEQTWLALAKANPIFGPLIEKVGPEGETHLQNVFYDKVKQKFGDDPIEINATAHFAVGTA